MSFEQGINFIQKDLRDLEDGFTFAGAEIAKEIRDGWVNMVHDVGAVDTGRFVQSIDWRQESGSGDFQQYVVDTSRDFLVTYSSLIEGGTKKMAARYPAKKAIESSDFAQTFDSLIDKSLSNAS